MTDKIARSVLVTGGTQGVGKGIAETYLATGAHVFICGRRPPAAPVRSGDHVATFIQSDIRDADACQALVGKVVEESGSIDILINNAGGSPPSEAATSSPRFVESIIRLNLIAPFILSVEACKEMRKSGTGGSIVNIASVSGTRPSPGTAAYGAAKAGLINATASLAQEWAPTVRVNSIIAGLIKTESAYDHYGGAAGVARIEKALPSGRMATPEDIANACLFLTSQAAEYISGASLEVFGGGEPPSFLSIAASAVEKAP